MAINKALVDQLLADYKKPEDIIGENGLLKQLTKAILERALQAELTDYLGFEKHDPAGHHSGNSRNGSGRKALKGDFGELGFWRGRFERHKKIAPWTTPLWFYVSVTGVVVHWMLYHLYAQVAAR